MTLRLEKSGPVARLLIDRPEARNAISMAMWEAFPALIAEAEDDPTIRVLELSAADGVGAFCAGADIKEMLAKSDNLAWREAHQAEINRVQSQLARVKVPTVAFVDGDCVGAGCGLALACDLRIATARARFGITPGKLGLVYPFHDIKLLVDLVGPGQAKRILYTGTLLNAEEAHRIGLVEILAESPHDLIEQILATSPHSAIENKRFVRRVLDGQVKDDTHTLGVFEAAFSGEDFAEGSRAFVEKRAPKF